jgi:hypothetical protein
MLSGVTATEGIIIRRVALAAAITLGSRELVELEGEAMLAEGKVLGAWCLVLGA